MSARKCVKLGAVMNTLCRALLNIFQQGRSVVHFFFGFRVDVGWLFCDGRMMQQISGENVLCGVQARSDGIRNYQAGESAHWNSLVYLKGDMIHARSIDRGQDGATSTDELVPRVYRVG
jgi:hypothetical protein